MLSVILNVFGNSDRTLCVLKHTVSGRQPFPSPAMSGKGPRKPFSGIFLLFYDSFRAKHRPYPVFGIPCARDKFGFRFSAISIRSPSPSLTPSPTRVAGPISRRYSSRFRVTIVRARGIGNAKLPGPFRIRLNGQEWSRPLISRFTRTQKHTARGGGAWGPKNRADRCRDREFSTARNFTTRQP